MANEFEYAPAPESRSVVDIKSSYGLFINGEFTDGGGKSFKTISPSTEEVLSEVAEAGPEGRRQGGQGGPSRLLAGVVADERSRTQQVPLPDRADHPGAGARDRRAGVDRQRQADQGVARRRHPQRRSVVLLLRRLGRQAGARRLRAGPAAHGGRGPGDPVELPVPDALLEDRPGPGRGQHGGAQACRDHAAHRSAVRGDLPAGRPAARRGEHPHRRGSHRARHRLPRGRGQGRVHRIHRRGSVHRQGSRRVEEEGDARAGRQGREHRLRRRARRPGRRGDRQRDLLQPGPRLLCGLTAAGAGVRGRGGPRPAQAPDEHPAGGRPTGQEHRRRRDQQCRAAGEDPRALRHRRGRGRRAGGRRSATCPTTASGSRRRSSPASARPTGSPARRSSARCSRC